MSVQQSFIPIHYQWYYLSHTPKFHGSGKAKKNEHELGDNCIQNFHLWRYIVGYTVGNFRRYIRRYTSPYENFEYGYPHSNVLLQFLLELEHCKLHKAIHHPTKYDIINDVKQYPTVYLHFWRYPIRCRFTKASALEFAIIFFSISFYICFGCLKNPVSVSLRGFYWVSTTLCFGWQRRKIFLKYALIWRLQYFPPILTTTKYAKKSSIRLTLFSVYHIMFHHV